MLKKLLILAGALAFAWGSSASADTLNPTQLAGFSGTGLVNIPAPPTNLSTTGGVTGLGSGAGVSYINTFSGTPGLVAGNNFKTIGSFLVNTINPNGGTPGNPATGGGQLVGVFALEGTVVPVGNNLGARFNQGVIAYYSSPTANYARNNLATWGIPGTANSGTLVGLYAVKQPVGVTETLVKGNPNAYTPNSNATTANIVGVPGGSNNNFTGGILTHDIGTFSGNANTGFTFNLSQPDFFANNGLADTFGRTVNGANPNPFNFLLPTFEHDFTDTFQTTPLADTFNFSANGNGAANLTIANDFFTAMSTIPDLVLPDGTVIPGGASLLDGGFGFATGLSGPAITDFVPDFNGTTSTTGDLVSDTTSANQFAPSIETGFVPFAPPGVPEIDPSSIAGALTLLGGGLLYLTDRRYRAKK